jgi:hypothetical protein
MKTRIKIIIVILGIIGLAISLQLDLLYVPLFVPVNLTNVEIKLEKTACYGPCPVYSVTIYGDGTVLYDGIQNVANIGKNIHQISKEDVDEIVELIYELNYFSLKDRYDANWTDDSTVITSVRINDDQKTVTNYGHFGPDRLHKIEKKIDDLTDFIPVLEINDDVNHNPNSIDGFVIDDVDGNVKHYPIDELHKMPCDEYQKIWNPEFVNVKESNILIDKLLDCNASSPLQKVLDSCNNDSPKERMTNILRYTNETHVILNLECEWKRIGYFVVD